ncbi:MAG: TIGR00282 family metallophosphoesterase [Alphaproteobacteria bacterium]|nr:TIGR00282 family metallophosphoesterase [Alphaproteobacteria bacterium]
MRILFCGDIVGRSGREVVIKYIPHLKQKLQLDCVIVNGENAAHGFGINATICKELYQAGVHVITTGNHIWDQRDVIGYIDKDPFLLRPLNFPPTAPGKGYTVYQTPKGQSVLVMNAMGRLFMDAIDDPFAAVDAVLKKMPLGAAVSAIVLDFHAEATSEKMSMAHFCDGRVSLVVGTHTHTPTADEQILDHGTACLTDAGMCGDYNSVVGMLKDAPIHRFTRKMPSERLSPAQGDGTLCGVYLETDDATGLALKVAPVRLGGRLSQTMPVIS